MNKLTLFFCLVIFTSGNLMLSVPKKVQLLLKQIETSSHCDTIVKVPIDCLDNYWLKDKALCKVSRWHEDIQFTPLMLAAYFGNQELVTKLLSQGADPCQSTCHGTVLSCAIHSGNIEVVELILDVFINDIAKKGIFSFREEFRDRLIGVNYWYKDGDKNRRKYWGDYKCDCFSIESQDCLDGDQQTKSIWMPSPLQMAGISTDTKILKLIMDKWFSIPEVNPWYLDWINKTKIEKIESRKDFFACFDLFKQAFITACLTNNIDAARIIIDPKVFNFMLLSPNVEANLINECKNKGYSQMLYLLHVNLLKCKRFWK